MYSCLMTKTEQNKIDIVKNYNTFYLNMEEFEVEHEQYLKSLGKTMSNLHHEVKTYGVKKEIFEDLLTKENGLLIFLTLTAFSMENLLQLITVIRLCDDEQLISSVHRDKWKSTKRNSDSPWSSPTVTSKVKKDEFFRKGIVNLFFEGHKSIFLQNMLPQFMFNCLSAEKLGSILYTNDDVQDTILRYKLRGSRAGKKKNNGEVIIEEILHELNIPYERGALSELVKHSLNSSRNMDYACPSKDNPLVVIESSYETTTSSHQGDKAKAEIGVRELLAKHYPKAIFIGFVDGVGWYVRSKDSRRMINAYDDVFTFHDQQIERFKNFMRGIFHD